MLDTIRRRYDILVFQAAMWALAGVLAVAILGHRLLVKLGFMRDDEPAAGH